MTWNPIIYEGATLILPPSFYEIRVPLDQHGKGMTGSNCEAGMLFSSTRRIWGRLVADDTHLVVATGLHIYVIYN